MWSSSTDLTLPIFSDIDYVDVTVLKVEPHKHRHIPSVNEVVSSFVTFRHLDTAEAFQDVPIMRRRRREKSSPKTQDYIR